MNVTLGLSSEALEKVLEQAGIRDGESVPPEILRKAIAEAISANNNEIIKQLMDMMSQFNVSSIMQQFMNMK